MSTEKKQRRSFYSGEEAINSCAPVIEEQQQQQIKEQPTSPAKETDVVSKYVEGYKINTSSYLEKHLNTARGALASKVQYVEAEYNNLKSATINEYNNLTSSITSLYDPRDQFLPSFIYALTTTLTGSVLVNKRSLPLRFVTPLIFGVASFKYFLPSTFENTKQAIKNWESESTPELLEFQKSVKGFAGEAEDAVVKTGDSLNQGLIDLVHTVRTGLSSEEKK